MGDIKLERDYHKYDLSIIESNPVRCPDPLKAREMEVLISQVKHEGDTIGGVISCVIKGCPVGLGEPEFGKLHAQLGAAMLSINAVKGFEYGEALLDRHGEVASKTTPSSLLTIVCITQYAMLRPTIAVAYKVASVTERTSTSVLRSSLSLPCSWNSKQ